MPKLNDTQTILLSTASRRDDLAFYPLEGVGPGARVTKAIATLIKAGFAEQRGEEAVFATIAGLAAIGVETEQGNEATAAPPAASTPRASKTDTVLTLLQREYGATMPDLIAATGWLPHTTRAALTGLRKKDEWRRLTKSPLPRISPSLLRLALAYELQAQALGGLPRTTQARLDQIARAKTQTTGTTPGMRLVREWNGKAHVVTIDDNRVIHWNNRQWNSLSEVAREITGTRWSGPAFFGLKRKAAA